MIIVRMFGMWNEGWNLAIGVISNKLKKDPKSYVLGILYGTSTTNTPDKTSL